MNIRKITIFAGFINQSLFYYKILYFIKKNNIFLVYNQLTSDFVLFLMKFTCYYEIKVAL